MSRFPGVYPRGNRYVAMPYCKERKDKIHLGTRDTDEEAYALIVEWKSGDRNAAGRTIKQVRKAWLDLHVESLAYKSRDNYTRDSKVLEATFGSRTPDELYDDFEAAQRWGLTVSANVVASSFSMLEWARKKRMCKSNPLDGVKGKDPIQRPGKVILTETEVRELAGLAMRVLPGLKGRKMAAMILFHYGSMLRPAHMFLLRECAIGWQTNRVDTPAVKRGRAQQTALLPIAREGLELLERGDDDDLIFTNLRGRAMRNNTVNNWFSPVRAAYGRPEMWFYDLKSGGTSRIVQAGGRGILSDLAKQVTHSDNGETLSRSYVELDIEESLQAVERADAVAATRTQNEITEATREQEPLGVA
jgi:hypothetical protein